MKSCDGRKSRNSKLALDECEKLRKSHRAGNARVGWCRLCSGAHWWYARCNARYITGGTMIGWVRIQLDLRWWNWQLGSTKREELCGGRYLVAQAVRMRLQVTTRRQIGDARMRKPRLQRGRWLTTPSGCTRRTALRFERGAEAAATPLAGAPSAPRPRCSTRCASTAATCIRRAADDSKQEQFRLGQGKGAREWALWCDERVRLQRVTALPSDAGATWAWARAQARRRSASTGRHTTFQRVYGEVCVCSGGWGRVHAVPLMDLVRQELGATCNTLHLSSSSIDETRASSGCLDPSMHSSRFRKQKGTVCTSAIHWRSARSHCSYSAQSFIVHSGRVHWVAVPTCCARYSIHRRAFGHQ